MGFFSFASHSNKSPKKYCLILIRKSLEDVLSFEKKIHETILIDDFKLFKKVLLKLITLKFNGSTLQMLNLDFQSFRLPSQDLLRIFFTSIL